MSRFQGVVANIAKRRHANMPDRHPSLQFVMVRTMEQIRYADRGHGGGCLQAGESCRVVHHVVRKQDFLSAASLKVSSGSVVHAAHYRNSREQQEVSAVPERVWRNS